MLTEVSSAAYAEAQVVKALGALKKFSSVDEIALEASVPPKRVRGATDWLATNGFLEQSAPGTGKLWRLSTQGLDVLKGILAADRKLRG
jgi:hypothetical protein